MSAEDEDKVDPLVKSMSSSSIVVFHLRLFNDVGTISVHKYKSVMYKGTYATVSGLFFIVLECSRDVRIWLKILYLFLTSDLFWFVLL